MFDKVTYPIRANRYVPHVDYMVVVGYDWSAATIKMEIRDAPNGGAVRATITPVVTVTTEEGLPVSTVTWTVPEATMEAMPLDPADPTKDVKLYYDVHITPSGGTKFVGWGGTFTVEHGVTQ